MGWPIDSFDVPTDGMDAVTDVLPRDNIHHMANLVNIMRTAVDAAGCPPLLDANGKIKAAQLPIDQRKHYVGDVQYTSSPILPYMCIWANGQAVSRTQYPDLNAAYAAAGYPYGAGDGVTTFNVPDVRDRVLVGRAAMGETMGAALRVTKAISGLDTFVLGAGGGDQVMMTHTHAGTITPVGDHTHQSADPVPGDLVGSGGTPINGVRNVTTGNTGPAGAHTHAVTIGLTGGGGSQNIQPAIVLNVYVQG